MIRKDQFCSKSLTKISQILIENMYLVSWLGSNLSLTSRLLVSVGHHTTDEVGLSLVEGDHQVVKLSLEVGGHRLSTLALLSFLVLWGLQGLEREMGFSSISSSSNLYCRWDVTWPG